jgi:hypothetical protein
MIIYNVTINVDESIHQNWLLWMKNKHIQEVLDTKKFQSARLVKVLIVEEMGGTTYSVQYFTDSREKLDAYYLEDAPRLREEGLRLFGDKILAFRTELEVLEEF